MACERRPLSRADRTEVFQAATKGLVRSYGDQLKQGLNDADLETLLLRVLGIFGGSCEPDRLSVTYQGAGLKIWGGWHIVNHVTEPPLIAGAKTIAMAREVYGIPDPDEDQMSLL